MTSSTERFWRAAEEDRMSPTTTFLTFRKNRQRHGPRPRPDAPRKRREGSSSPLPIDDLEPPLMESMHKGVSKFDLRDDEWMMVEDEFLETAKFFTRHLHIAEYEKLKATIEEKKKEAAKIARPVVANATMSTNGAMKEKARVQELKQKKAIRDVFASQEEEEEDEIEERATMSSRTNLASSFMASRNNPTAGSKPTLNKSTAQDSDSDDLDALRPSARPASKATTTPTPARKSSTAGRQKSALSPALNSRLPSPTFAKPAPPTAAAKSRSRLSRPTPFDMLDDWVPKKSKTLSESSPVQPAKAPHISHTPTTSKKSQSFASSDDRDDITVGRPTASIDSSASTRDQGSGNNNSPVSKETMDRLAKRKAAREKVENDEKERRRKAAKLDDIPTFLF